MPFGNEWYVAHTSCKAVAKCTQDNCQFKLIVSLADDSSNLTRHVMRRLAVFDQRATSEDNCGLAAPNERMSAPWRFSTTGLDKIIEGVDVDAEPDLSLVNESGEDFSLLSSNYQEV